jgi:hypothetical protein
MPDTTTAAGRLARAVAVAGLTTGLFGGVAATVGNLDTLRPDPAAAVSAAVPRVPHCPKIPAPATPPPAVAPGDSVSRCRRPPREPDVIVPEVPAATSVPPERTRARKVPPAVAVKPRWHPPERRERPGQLARPGGPTAMRTRPASAPPVELPVRAGGYAVGLPADDGPGAAYRRSLIYSGLLGLVLASVGMALVGHRRRTW